MTLKNAALLALLGMILLTVLVTAGLLVNMLGFVRGVVPAIRLLSSLIHVMAAVSAAIFFYVFHRAQA